LVSQLRRAAVSVASNIAEGSKRLPQDNKHYLRYALGSLAECDTQLIIAEKLGYGAYAKKLKATIMSLTMGVRAYGKSLSTP
ncbi:MAG: four helix bundle protein, partial [Kiritimatiellae bacterium]|nr:four helix bundle protein [Kiritimatiellia bacterium]